MPESLTAQSKRLGISRQTLAAWRDDGLDLNNTKAVAVRLRGMKKPPSEDLAAAKLRRARAEATKAELQVARESGELVERAGIASQGEAIGRSLAAELARAEADLPGLLAGRTGAQISKLLKDRFRQIRLELSEMLP